MAHRVMVRLGLSDYETPIEERPPGRGRGSSVAMLVGYLIGLSHIDPLEYNLSLERFLPDDLMAIALDIDLDWFQIELMALNKKRLDLFSGWIKEQKEKTYIQINDF